MNKTQVLVVEDDSPIRNLITTTLKTNNYRYLTAVNGESAISQTASHNPDMPFLSRHLLLYLPLTTAVWYLAS